MDWPSEQTGLLQLIPVRLTALTHKANKVSTLGHRHARQHERLKERPKPLQRKDAAVLGPVARRCQRCPPCTRRMRPCDALTMRLRTLQSRLDTFSCCVHAASWRCAA